MLGYFPMLKPFGLEDKRSLARRAMIVRGTDTARGPMKVAS